MESYYKRIKDEELSGVLNMIDDIKEDLNALSEKPIEHIYSNKDMLKILGITDKTLTRYRNDGLLPYYRYDDKYWYTQSDLDAFISVGRANKR